MLLSNSRGDHKRTWSLLSNRVGSNDRGSPEPHPPEDHPRGGLRVFTSGSPRRLRGMLIPNTMIQSAPGEGSVVLFDPTITGVDAQTIDTGANGIAGGYDILEAFIYTRSDHGTAVPDVFIIVNDDASAIYDRQFIAGIAGAATAGTNIGTSSWSFPTHGSGGSAGYVGLSILTMVNYDQTSFWKSAIILTSAPDATSGNNIIAPLSVGYRSTNAITRLRIDAGGGQKFKVGSRLLILAR